MGDYDMYLAGGQATYYSETLRCMDGLGWDWADLMGGCHYMDEEWHELVLSILECTDESKLPELFKEFQAQFRERCVSIGIYQGVSAFVVRNGIEGVTLSGIGVPDFTHVYEAG